MDFLITLFRDKISGFWYILYILLCLLFMFALLGVVGDRKRHLIEVGLKEKKRKDIESGKEAKIAAMESKQVLDVMKEEKKGDVVPNANDTSELAKKEETPSVLVIGADGSSNAGSPAVAQQSQPTQQSSQAQVQPVMQQAVSQPTQGAVQQVNAGQQPVVIPSTQG